MNKMHSSIIRTGDCWDTQSIIPMNVSPKEYEKSWEMEKAA
jgi:hypothetical protein